MNPETEFDLRTISNSDQPDATLGMIELVISSDFNEDWTWVVVEGTDDVEIYERLFDYNKAIVCPSLDEEGRCGCSNVEEIVETILNGYNFYRIIGLRDADYTPYDENYVVPQNIFLTDCHDIEIQMLENNRVIEGLETKKSGIKCSLQNAYSVMREVAYLRAYSLSIQGGFNFSGYVKCSNFWNQDEKKMVIGWKKKLFDSFFATEAADYGHAPTICDLNKYVKDKNLENEPSWKICQGHDVVNFLHWTGSATDLYKQFIELYNNEAFAVSEMYGLISQWERNNGVKILL